MISIRILIIALLFSGTTVFGQIDSAIFKLNSTQLKKAARKASTAGDFYSSISFYKYYIAHKSDVPEFYFKKAKMTFEMANNYRLARDYKNAESAYVKAYELNPKKYVKALYYQALMQKMLGDYTAAKTTFAKFKKESKVDDSKETAILKKLVKNDIAGCDSINVFKNKGPQVEVNHLDTSINKAYMDVSPFPLNDSTIIYASLKSDTLMYFNRADTTRIPPVSQFYIAGKNGEEWKHKANFEGPFNIDNVGVTNGVFSPEGDRFFFTRCEKNWKEESFCHIYVSAKKDGEWQTPTEMPEPINLPNCNSTQPAVGYESGKEYEVLYFVSDRTELGAKGGKDIWFSVYDPGKKMYGPAKNAGSKINTVGDELTPFYDFDSKTLFFSSTGWPGMGGLDVFKAFGELNKWTPPYNLRAPANSSVDDIYYTVLPNNEEGFFVSNREGSIALKNEYCCFDIYQYVKKMRLGLNVMAYKSENKQVIKVVSDHKMEEFKDKTRLDSVEIKVFLVNDSIESEDVLLAKFNPAKTDLTFLKLEENQNYRIIASRPGYFTNGFEFTTNGLTVSDTIFQPIGLHELSKDPIVIPNIYYEFDKADLTKDSKYTLDTTIYKLLIENPNIIVEIGSHTDSRGSDEYNIKLSQKRAESVVAYLMARNIEARRLRAKGYGETRHIAKNENADGSDNPDGRQKNRRTEFRIVGEVSKYSEIIYTE
ncbi:MAG: OmpA family protein [Bacteroidetes bacterium]|nr:OmpA family protein [Bacteroidota bacterium]